MRTNFIRKYISRKLRESGVNVYYHHASNSAKFPYIVYDLTADFNGDATLYDLEVNIWNNNTDIAEIEDIADVVEDLMDDELHLDANGLLIFKRRSRGHIDDSNKEIDRIMIKLDMRYYK